MHTVDFAPLYRSVVGFDRLASLLETAAADAATGYPPFTSTFSSSGRKPATAMSMR